jgi:hypothetical protein
MIVVGILLGLNAPREVVVIREWTENNATSWELIDRADTVKEARVIIENHKAENPRQLVAPALSTFSIYQKVE